MKLNKSHVLIEMEKSRIVTGDVGEVLAEIITIYARVKGAQELAALLRKELETWEMVVQDEKAMALEKPLAWEVGDEGRER